MINLNGKLIQESVNVLNASNRAFKYGDALFETLKIKNLDVLFIEDHYFRLMASMRMLRMEIPMSFTLEFFESEILSLVKSNNLTDARVRFSIFRKDGGLYIPISNKVSYLVESTPLKITIKEKYKIDLFKDYYIYSGILSTLKTTNKITNVLASIYASENEFENCVLVNEKKQVVEAINGNIFLVNGNTIKTPAIESGCVKGIARKKIIEIILKNNEFSIEEGTISPFDLQKADEIFLSNVIVGVQPVTSYKKTNFNIQVAKKIAKAFDELV
jgi:branched-chain amino acid aminotransferase